VDSGREAGPSADSRLGVGLGINSGGWLDVIDGVGVVDGLSAAITITFSVSLLL